MCGFGLHIHYGSGSQRLLQSKRWGACVWGAPQKQQANPAIKLLLPGFHVEMLLP